MRAHAVWTPDPAFIKTTNIYHLMQEVKQPSYDELHRWSVKNRPEFWRLMLEKLSVRLHKPYQKIVDLDKGATNPSWLVGAELNIIDSCFQADEKAVAIYYGSSRCDTMTYGELRRLANRVANSLVAIGLKKGDAVAIDMLMTAEAVAIYLGCIAAGMPVIGIADSFAADEIATRLRLGSAKLVFTQDCIHRGDKVVPMYEKVVAAQAPKAIVLQAGATMTVNLRNGDKSWNDFLVKNDQFKTVSCKPHDACNILFSSGTTGEPKAIPWNHTTPIKCAADAYLHHDIRPNDILAWPTSLGWMMGPWLIYASLMNKAAMSLYYGVAATREFGDFVAKSKVTMLGVVPSLVKTWRTSNCMSGVDWNAIRCFSSTGECSNPDDMTFLMKLAGNKPVIEYCGGTEIGGGYITGTMIQPCVPATFTTPALGIDFVILDEAEKPATNGELFIVPPSIGLSLTLLNKDHQEVYYDETPKGPNGEQLRRHGDQMESLGDGYLRAHGRVDDTMNLGGIKVSSIEIEKVLNKVPGVVETAAIAIPPKGGGPSLLVIYAVTATPKPEKALLMKSLQDSIKKFLNPLFKIHDLVYVDALPRTASNKVMRRVLRSQYQSNN